jgi:hypothetical protein
LKFQQQIKIKPGVFELQSPDTIIMALAQVVGSKAGFDRVQGFKVYAVQPFGLHKTGDEILHESRMAKQ